MASEQPRRMQVRDVTMPIEAVCRQFLADRGIPALYLGELTRPLLDEIHALLDRAHAEARAEGLRQATEGWEREWAVRLRDGSQLEPDGEVYVRAHAQAEGANGSVVSRLVGPWEPAPGAPCPMCTGPIRETVGMVCQTCGTDYAATEQPEPAPLPEHPAIDKGQFQREILGMWPPDHEDEPFTPLTGPMSAEDIASVLAVVDAPYRPDTPVQYLAEDETPEGSDR